MGKKKNKRDEFLSLIPPEAKKVLDVGCADGNLGLKIKERGAEVVGIERDEKLCALAKEKLNQVFLVDTENFQLPHPKGYFDCILYADLLEHLTDPLTTLKNHKSYLNDAGCIVASIPNIRYYKVIIRLLLGGTWDYTDKGILDKSHLRFFTLLNIKELFMQAGYEIVEIKRNVVAARGFRFLNFILFGKLKELLVYQYYIKARKSKDLSFHSINKRKIHQF